MAATPRFAFEAAGQSAGYYYQLRYALLRALQQIRRDPTGSVSVEKLDDISLWNASTPAEVDQLKHTTNANVVFSDTTPQVWRTLANWAVLLGTPAYATTALKLTLVTNAQIAATSSLAKLGAEVGSRDVQGAIDLLRVAASKSKNADTLEDRQKFLGLEPSAQQRLISSITVLPDAPNLSSVGAELDEILFYACDAARLAEFREELEGWWLQRVAADLSSGSPSTVGLIEIDAKVSFLREKYKRSLLTIDVEPAEGEEGGLLRNLFIRQMQAVAAGTTRLKRAQRDFLRAGTQRSRWIRDLKLDPAELNRYDNELEEHWAAKHAILLDDLGETADDQQKAAAGRNILGWAETRQVPIRGVEAQFLTSGSYHTLADQMRVGWHPDFLTLFKDSDGGAET